MNTLGKTAIAVGIIFGIPAVTIGTGMAVGHNIYLEAMKEPYRIHLTDGGDHYNFTILMNPNLNARLVESERRSIITDGEDELAEYCRSVKVTGETEGVVGFYKFIRGFTGVRGEARNCHDVPSAWLNKEAQK